MEIAESIKSDRYLYFKSMAGLPHLGSFSGDKKQSLKMGEELLRFGDRYSNIRSQAIGHICIGYHYLADGDLTKALASFQKAFDVAQDPFYAVWARL